MLRRTIFEAEPMSRLAAWSARFAWFALAVAALSVIVLRSGMLELVPALSTFAAALAFAALAVLFAFASFVTIWRQGLAGLGRALLGLFLGLLLLGYPAYLGYRSLTLPAINDITTDPGNPPRFDVLARLRPRGTADYPGGKTAELQRAAYPDVVPLQVNLPPRPAFDLVLGLVNKRKWLVVDQRPPAPGRRDGTIEAVARTLILGLRDDVVIRVSPLGEGSRVDLRSASRYSLHDFGSNASRVRSLLEDIDDAVNNAPDTPAVPEKKAPAPAKKKPAEKK